MQNGKKSMFTPSFRVGSGSGRRRPWIERTKPIESASSLQNDFQTFLAASGRTALPGAARERLFQDFRVWRKTQAKRSAE
jgi:hypothetical protein